MRLAPRHAVCFAVLGIAGCAIAVPADGGDAVISGTTDLAPPEDIVGVNWDDYPDKSGLLDASAQPFDVVNAPADLGALVDAGAPQTGCGVPGAICCSPARCNRGSECRGGVCAEVASCGAVGQPCCGVAACGPGNSCLSGRCEATVTCGASGGPCCASATPCLPSLLCVSGACVPCGGPGQSCCAGSTVCFRGLSCGGGLCRAAM
ncbi:MAG: hypothetical protein R3A48_15870 [Polyangiales bacterium]